MIFTFETAASPAAQRSRLDAFGKTNLDTVQAEVMLQAIDLARHGYAEVTPGVEGTKRRIRNWIRNQVEIPGRIILL